MDPFDRVAEIYKALAHPIRLQILQQLLLDGEACVCHLEARLGQRQAYISQQLAKLRQAKLVCDRRDGMNVFYSVTSDSVREMLDQALVVANGGAPVEVGITVLDLPEQADSKKCTCPMCDAP